MQRLLILLALCPISIHLASAQNAIMDSLKWELTQARHDTSRVLLLAELAFRSQFNAPDATKKRAQQALTLARKIHYKKGEGRALMAMSITPREQGDLTAAFNYALQSLYVARSVQDRSQEALSLGALASIHSLVQDYQEAIHYTRQSLAIYKSVGDTSEIARKLSEMAMHYTGMKIKKFESPRLLDSARHYNQQAELLAKQISNPHPLTRVMWNYGRIATEEGNYAQALSFYRKALQLAQQSKDFMMLTGTQYGMAKVFYSNQQPDSSLHYAKLAYRNSLTKNSRFITSSSELLAKIYEDKNNLDSAYHYLRLNKAAVDSLFVPNKLQELQRLTLAEQQRQLLLAAAQKDYQNQVRLYGVVAALLVFLLVAVLLYRNNRQKQKANRVLQYTLTQLKATQKQLIQKEKLVALQAQMNPHFVFNCLNSIKYFTLKSDAQQASSFLSKFARLIRLVLENSRSERVTLSSELEALQLYIELESMRFDDKLHHRVEVSSDIDPEDLRIPPLLLQPFVENAIWHGLMPKAEGGTISISVHQPKEELLHIEITDDGVGRVKAAAQKKKATGKHKSFAVQATAERVHMINQLYNVQTQMQLVDLVDSFGEPCGTKVVLEIPV